MCRPSNGELYHGLKDLIECRENRELQCREYLEYVDHLLIKSYPVSLIYKSTEYRGHKGNTDYIISANIQDESGINCVQAYIWELKAPQCYIFTKDTNNRLMPTRELFSAENQLINYHYELQGDEQFKRKAKVTHSHNVKLGGIIIGSRSTLVSDYYSKDRIAELFEEALAIRKHYFYEPNNIRLITWDTVLRQLSVETHINEVYMGQLMPPVTAAL